MGEMWWSLSGLACCWDGGRAVPPSRSCVKPQKLQLSGEDLCEERRWCVWGASTVRVGHLGGASAIRLGQAIALVRGELGAPSLQPFGYARHT
jgi:hypothetical protein